MPANTPKPEYHGLRALLLTRVSTAEQAKKYSHAAQERVIRQKIIEPLGLKLDERHVIHDTYSGLEYRYREALDIILALAERSEFDVLCMDVLDRGLGRKALAREMFRMQLRELGIRILTTDPSDHADDDSLEGQIMRFIKGYKAEDEVNDLVRRTSSGRREKALGDEQREPKIIGQGTRPYGFKYVYDEKGKRVGYELNYRVVHVDENGEEWTEVTVVLFIFTQAANGSTTRQIAKALNDMGIPTAYTSKGMKAKNMKRAPLWQPTVISRMLKNSDYWGEHREFKTRSLGRQPGKKYHVRQMNEEAEQIVIPCPAIVSKELAEQAQEHIRRNFTGAGRHNPHPEESLLRSGLAKCGHCGSNLIVNRDRRKNHNPLGYYATYICGNHAGSLGRCPGCSIPVSVLDEAAKKRVRKIIRDPKEVEEKVRTILSGNPILEQRKKMLDDLKATQKKQASMRENLNIYMQEGTLDAGTREYLSAQLGLLAQEEEKRKKDLADEQALQEKYNLLQENLAKFKERCVQWRTKLDDPAFNPPYKFWREACEYFGITGIVWKKGSEPPYEIVSDPPSIVYLSSRSAS
jgi:DNA invertase Pin-like site-specific DNA recombinase